MWPDLSRIQFLRGFSDVELTLVGGALLALLVLLMVAFALTVRYCCSKPAAEELDEPAHAEDYAHLTVVVDAHGHEAELQVETDAFDSYEEVSTLTSSHSS